MSQKPANIPEDLLRKLYLDEKLNQGEIALKLGCSQTAVWRRLKKYGIPRRLKSEVSLLVSKHHRQDFDGSFQEKAYLLGFCKGDIHVWKRHKNSQTIRLMSSTTKSDQVELFKELFAPYGHIYIGKPDKRGAVHMSAYVNLTLDFLLDLEDKVPDWILAKDDAFWAYFAGYADAEAHIGVHNGYAVFKLDSYDKNIISQLHSRLMNNGIFGPAPFICIRQGKKTKYGHPYRKDMWRLQVSAKSSLLLLFQHIGRHLKHSKRIQDMHQAIHNVEKRNTRAETKRQRRIKG